MKERSSAVVIIASELGLRKKLVYFVGSAFLGAPYFFNLPSMILTGTWVFAILPFAGKADFVQYIKEDES